MLPIKKKRKRRSDYGKTKDIDKKSIQYLKYRDIALEFIKQGYNNIRAIYKKYYPNASEESIECEAYRLLGNVRFQIALEEVYNEIKPEELNLGTQALRKLYSLMTNSKKEMIQLEAAIWLGKSEGKFIDKSHITQDTTLRVEEQKDLLQRFTIQ